MKSRFREHVSTLQQSYESLLTELSLESVDGILIHSGSEQEYFADDRIIPFQAYGHFRHWLPVNRPDQFVLISPAKTPRYLQVVPADFWYDQSIDNAEWWSSNFDITRISKLDELPGQLVSRNLIYLGPRTDLARELGLDPELINPRALLAALDYHRAYKTGYEVAQLKEANRRGLLGHEAARLCFLGGGNESDIHQAFLAASEQLEEDTPYTNIVALDDKAAILHYQYKRRGPAHNRSVLLIDAGCRVNGYGSDITRTWAKASADALFKSLILGVDAIEQRLVAEVKPGISYVSIHEYALRQLADLLLELQICRGSSEELWAAQVPQLFMPHGVGHLLGIQVHDVGGRQIDPNGTIQPPPAHSPALRNTRTLAENMVFTIEPGCYFIPMLLEQERQTERGKMINWELVERLYPSGGIRIEDNVRVTADGVENLTRSTVAA